MTFEHSANLISVQLWNPRASTPQQFRRLLVGSFCIHLTVLVALMGLRLAPATQSLSQSYEVTLVSFEEISTPAQSSALRQQPTHSPVPAVPEHRPASREKLAETIAESLETIVVPEERSVTPVRSESAQPSRKMPAQTAAIETLSPPPAVPELAIAQASPPHDVASTPEVASDKLSEALAKTVQAVQVPSLHQTPRQTTNPSVSQRTLAKDRNGSTQPNLPEVPPLKPVEPVPHTPRNQNSSANTGRLSETLKELVQSVQIPAVVKSQPVKPATSQVPVTKAAPSEARKPLAESLKDVVQAVPIPKPSRSIIPAPSLSNQPLQDLKTTDGSTAQALAALKEVIPPPQVPNFTKVEPAKASKPSPDAQAAPLHAHLDQQIAKLVIPEVNDVPKTSRVGESLNNIASRTTKALQLAGGDIDGNPYWARVRARIDREWIAAPVDVQSNQPIQVLVAFRLERSGSVKNVKIVRSSGNTFFDLAAQRAVLAADPLPAFPTELSESHVDLQFQFTVRKDGP